MCHHDFNLKIKFILFWYFETALHKKVKWLFNNHKTQTTPILLSFDKGLTYSLILILIMICYRITFKKQININTILLQLLQVRLLGF